MDTEEAWAKFRNGEQIKKAGLDTPSIKGQLDTIQAQLQEILTNSKRTAEIVPRVLGDQGAIDAANDEAGMQAMMGGMMGGAPGGMPDSGMPMGMPMGPEGGEEEGAEDEDQDEGGEMTDDEIEALFGGGAGAPASGGVPATQEEAPAETGEMPPEGMPTEEQPTEEIPEEGAEEIPTEELPPEELPPEEMPLEEPVPEELPPESISADPIEHVIDVLDQELMAAVVEDRTSDARDLVDAKSALEGFRNKVSFPNVSMTKSAGCCDDTDTVEASDSMDSADESDLSKKNEEPIKESSKQFKIKTGLDMVGKGADAIEYGNKNSDEKVKNAGYDLAHKGGKVIENNMDGAYEQQAEREYENSKKASALSEPPSFSSIMSDLRSNPKGSMYEHFLGIRKSMERSDSEMGTGIWEGVEPIGPGNSDALDRVPPEQIDAFIDFMSKNHPEIGADEFENRITAETQNELVDEFLATQQNQSLSTNGNEGIKESAINKSEFPSDTETEELSPEDKVLIDKLVQICIEEGITIEQLQNMSDEDLAALVVRADGTSQEPIEDDSVIEKSDSTSDMPSAHECPMAAIGGNSGNPDSIASSKPVNLIPNKSEGTVSSPSGIIPPSGETDPDSIPQADPTTGPLKEGLNVNKSAEGKHIMSMAEMLDIRKSQSRPDSNCGTNGDISRPDLGPVKKTAEPIDYSTEGLAGFKKSVQQDWDNYKAMKAQREL